MPVAPPRAILKGRQLSSAIEQFVRRGIERGELKPGQRLGSAKQLARDWKTSYGAVRQSLEALAAKGLVERRARAGTFISAHADGGGSTGDARDIIGLLVPDIRMPEYSLVTRHLQDAGHRAHFEVLVSSTDNERERYDKSILRHLGAGVGGLVLVSPQQARISLETLLQIERSGIPVVNYARVISAVPWPTVQTDTYQVVYLPIHHLCQIGRRRIAFLSYPVPEVHGPQMHYGLYRAIAEAGLTADNVIEFTLPDAPYINGWTDNRALGEILGSWLDAHPRIDALCCTHDHIAALAMRELNRRGVRVPDDVAVTGAGGMAEFFGFPAGEITTVDTRIDKAAAEIIRLLRHGDDVPPSAPSSVISIQPELIVGRSTVSNPTDSSMGGTS